MKKYTYDETVDVIKTEIEEHLMATRRSWGDGKSEWVKGIEIWTPVCILLENGELKYQNADGILSDWAPTEEDKQADDWYII